MGDNDSLRLGITRQCVPISVQLLKLKLHRPSLEQTHEEQSLNVVYIAWPLLAYNLSMIICPS